MDVDGDDNVLLRKFDGRGDYEIFLDDVRSGRTTKLGMRPNIYRGKHEAPALHDTLLVEFWFDYGDGPSKWPKPGHRFAESLGAACDDSDFPCKLFLHFLVLVEVH